MHINQKPPLWPYLAALLLLLVLCLAAPRYWPHRAATIAPDGDLPEADTSLHTATPNAPGASRAPLEFRGSSAPGGIGVFLPESEERFAGQSIAADQSSATASPALVWIEPPVLDDPGLAPFDMAGVVRACGRQLARVQLDRVGKSVVKTIATRLLSLPEPPAIIESPPELYSPVLITGPSDRLAMVPQRSGARPELKLPRSTPLADVPEDRMLQSEAIGWPVPSTLIRRLKRLQRQPDTCAWAEHALAELLAVAKGTGATEKKLPARLRRIEAFAGEALELAESTRDERLRSELLRVHYGLARRADVWASVHRVCLDQSDVPHARLPGSEQLAKSLTRLVEMTAGSHRGQGWREYLRLHPLTDVADGRAELYPGERRRLAQQILARMSTARLNASQRQFIASQPVASLGDDLRHWAAEPVDVEALAVQLEEYEQQRSPRLANSIAAQKQKLGWSPNAEHRELAEDVEMHYCNANLRLAISGKMLNKLLPEPGAPHYQPVRDRIVGTPVRGSARTASLVQARLVPDDKYIRIGLEAHGMVDSNTVANGGSAHLRSYGTTEFHARKLVVLTPAGLKIWPAVATAENLSRLVDVDTPYDGLPIIGSWVRSEAISKYREKRPFARSEVESNVADQARSALDERMESYLARLEQRYTNRLHQLRKTGVHVLPVDMRTTDQRLVARLRVAGDDQLAAHTPRCRAPADSLASVQIHESVLTNVMRPLDLNGRRFTAPELRDLARETFSRLNSKPASEVPADTIFHFDYQDALQIHFDQGQVEITLALVELVHDGHSIRQFKVHAFYRPQVTGLEVQLVRDGALGIEGRIRTSDRARLHAVFNKVLPDERPIQLFAPERFDLPLLSEAMITQALLEDGWLGMAIGPEIPGRTAQLSRALR